MPSRWTGPIDRKRPLTLIKSDIFAALLSINKTELDKILIMYREPGYKLLWAFTRTLSKRLRETNEKMASFLAMSNGF